MRVASLLLLGGVAHAAAWLVPVVSPRCAAPRLQLDDDDFDAEAEVNLVESESGRTLPCFMAASLEYEGTTFAALYPVNAPTSLARLVNDERLVPLDEEDETDEMLAAATAACLQADIELLQTPVVLTARGPGLEMVDGDAEALEYADDGEADETEEALVLAEFSFNGFEVLVVQTLDPLYVVGKKLDDKTFAVPSDDEIDSVSDTIEQLVVEFEEGFEEEGFNDEFDDDFAA